VLQNARLAVGYLALWALVNGLAVFGGIAQLPGLSLAFGFAGAVAVVALSALLSRANLMAAVRYCGQNSLVIYLAFFLPMAVSRIALLKLGLIPDVGTVSLIVTACGVVGPLLLYWIVRDGFGAFLFRRPARARLAPARQRLVPAE
jgi:uncharacterized membrane protein YcfT